MKSTLALIVIFYSVSSLAWGELGHRTVAELAEKRLTPKAKAKVKEILGSESMADASIWADQVRNDTAYNYLKPWHYVTIPDKMTYNKSTKNPNGDVISKTVEIIKNFKDNKGTLSQQDQKLYLRLLIHFIGDIHQPLHVSSDKDLGGNICMVRYFGAMVNLHSLWDTRMLVLDADPLSLANTIDSSERNQSLAPDVNTKTSVLSWAQESQNYRDFTYPPPVSRSYCQSRVAKKVFGESEDHHHSDDEDGLLMDWTLQYQDPAASASLPELSDAYKNKHLPMVYDRILLAGIRLANTLNTLFK